VYRIGYSQTVYVKLQAEVVEPVFVRVFGMERYTVPHTPRYRIDEYDRHPFREMKNLGGGLYCFDYDFPYEQRYRLRFKIGETVLEAAEDVYALEQDLLELQVFKGDTHLHSTCSDGESPPFEVAVNYRMAGFDFIALTDHHRMWPSVEVKEAVEKLTDQFTVIRAEEVHNANMGYFHIVNLGGSFSVNTVIEEDYARVDGEVETLMETMEFPPEADPKACAWRKWIADKIHEGGGVAVMAHPFWTCFDEYNVQSADMAYAWRNGHFDALEVLAGNPMDGDNLTVALWADLRAEGVRIPVVGASDAHNCTSGSEYFNHHFSLVFAKDREDLLNAICQERAVAVNRRTDTDFFVFGSFRLVKYARFLLDCYYPGYYRLTQRHGQAMAAESGETLAKTEGWIREYREKFFTSVQK
jgi:predicted metal-dependent phosphoesterase TrpH